MRSDPGDPPKYEGAIDDDDSLAFLRDEGLPLLALYRRIRNKQRRQLVVDLIRIMSEKPSEANGA